jgi:HEAT repeat protein
MLDQAFEALKTYDWGAERSPLEPINEAVISSRNDAVARKDLEARLIAALKTPISRDAKDYVCRKLMQIGTAASVSTVAELLADKDLSHMARFALERNPAPEAAQALRDALPRVAAPLKVGIISSLGQRRDVASVASLANMLNDTDGTIARSAALALGAIRTSEAAKALGNAKATAPETQIAITDASLSCAESLLALGNKSEALVIYKSLLGEGQSKHVRLAATRGLLACSGK